MKKKKQYILYIILGIIIISLFIVIILTITDPLKELYNKQWYIFKYDVYNKDELLSSVNVPSTSYILFSKNEIEYCLNFGEKCEKHSYESNKETITSNVDNVFAKGEYRYEIDKDGNLTLSKEIDGRTVVYSFALPVG